MSKIPSDNSEKNIANSNSSPVVISTARKTAEIIPFPAERIVRVPDTVESLNDTLLEHKVTLLLEVQDDLLNKLHAQLMNTGLSINEEDLVFLKDWTFVVEAFRAMLYHQYGIPHVLHQFMEEGTEIDENLDISLVNYTTNDEGPDAA